MASPRSPQLYRPCTNQNFQIMMANCVPKPNDHHSNMCIDRSGHNSMHRCPESSNNQHGHNPLVPKQFVSRYLRSTNLGFYIIYAK